MRLVIAAVGRLKDGPERELYQRYAKRLEDAGRGIALGPLKLAELPESRAASAELRRNDEALRLLEASKEAEVRVVLEVTGKPLASDALAQWIATQRDGGTKGMAFLIGGPDGHGPAVLNAGQMRLSFGPMTLPHGLARIVLAEQLYRAATIISGHPYHRA
jgi:23S rRNA (pseudouridine1915-N3)-methyltransferase